MRFVLQRERARADRMNDRFSVLVVSPQPPGNGPAELRRLTRVLKRRLRTTDEIGWLDQQRLAAVLPSTPADGAWTVARDVKMLCPKPRLELKFAVFCYPVETGDPRTSDTVDDRRAQTGVNLQPAGSLDTLFCLPMPSWKRALDITSAATGLVVLSPLLLTVAAAVKLTSPGPVFFRQQRAGYGGRPFVIYKFRSMVTDAELRKRELLPHNEQDGPAFKLKADPRVTSLGRLLRASSIDELPQLWNVLRGDMSLVGPRPLPCDEAEACARWQRQRLDVTPGLTCFWQVNGRSRVSFDDWVRMDVQYIRQRAPWTDLKLLLKTIPAVIFQRGA